jgi:hypothetical protein
MGQREIDMGDVITIRRATNEDRDAIERLAQLDSRREPRGEALLAFVGGELRAALPLHGGEALADPFYRTAEVVDLLRARAAQNGRPPAHRFAIATRPVQGSAA